MPPSQKPWADESPLRSVPALQHSPYVTDRVRRTSPPTDVSSLVAKMGLGTAQFGLDYGINNPTGKVPPEEVRHILRMARDAGIDLLDTAAAYGTAQAVLGDCLTAEPGNFKIVSKISPQVSEPTEVLESFNQVISELQVETLHGLLVHDFARFTVRRDNWDVFRQLRTDGRVRKLGFSVYYPTQIEWLIQNDVDFDVVQLPYNVLDQRFADYFPRLKERNVEVHVRSVFLQGLFFVPENELPPHFTPVVAKLKRLRAMALENEVPLAAVPLSFALSNLDVARIVIGVNSARGLQENIDSLLHFDRVQSLRPQLVELSESDERILLPFNWPDDLGPSVRSGRG